MNTQKEETIQDILTDPAISKQNGVGASFLSFLYMVVGLFLFFSILSVVNGQFEKIIICILFLIMNSLSSEATFSDLKEHGKSVRPLTGMFLMWWSFIPRVVAYGAIIYYVFFYR